MNAIKNKAYIEKYIFIYIYKNKNIKKQSLV